MAWLFSTWYGIDRRIYHLLHGVVVFNIYAVFFKGKRRLWPKGRRRVVINTFGAEKVADFCDRVNPLQGYNYLWCMTSEVWPLGHHETASHPTWHDITTCGTIRFFVPRVKHMLMFFVLSKSAFSFFVSFFTVQLLFNCCFVVWKRGTTPEQSHVDVFCPIKISVLIFHLIFHRSVVV